MVGIRSKLRIFEDGCLCGFGSNQILFNRFLVVLSVRGHFWDDLLTTIVYD